MLSAFTGLGGLDLGLERAGFNLIGCIENSAEARASFSVNHHNSLMLEPYDIQDLVKQLPCRQLDVPNGTLDLLSGGPPCQPFSTAAQWAPNGRAGLRDWRRGAIDAFLKLIAFYKPRAILIENVAGFVTGKTNALPYLRGFLGQLNNFSGTSYSATYRLVDAANYGVPQHRRRAIVVAFRDGQDFQWPEYTHTERPVRAWDALGDLRVVDPPQAVGKWADLLPSIPEGKNYQWHTDRGGGVPLFGYRTRFWSFLLKLSKDHPSWTLPAQPGPATGPFHWDSRPLSITEMLRLQSFPAHWKVWGTHQQQVRQVGNATPPLLAEIMGRRIREQLSGYQYFDKPTLLISHKESVPGPENPTPVPYKYQHLIRSYAAHPGPGKGPRPILERT